MLENLNKNEYCSLVDENEHFFLEKAISKNSIETTTYILKNEILNTSIVTQAFISACEIGSFSLVKLLIEDYRVDPNFDNSYGLQMACKGGFIDIVDLLVKDKRINVESEDNAALKFCYFINDNNIKEEVSPQHIYIIKKLLKTEAVINTIFEEDVLNLIDIAVKQQDYELFDFLESHFHFQVNSYSSFDQLLNADDYFVLRLLENNKISFLNIKRFINMACTCNAFTVLNFLIKNDFLTTYAHNKVPNLFSVCLEAKSFESAEILLKEHTKEILQNYYQNLEFFEEHFEKILKNFSLEENAAFLSYLTPFLIEKLSKKQYFYNILLQTIQNNLENEFKYFATKYNLFNDRVMSKLLLRISQYTTDNTDKFLPLITGSISDLSQNENQFLETARYNRQEVVAMHLLKFSKVRKAIKKDTVLYRAYEKFLLSSKIGNF